MVLKSMHGTCVINRRPAVWVEVGSAALNSLNPISSSVGFTERNQNSCLRQCVPAISRNLQIRSYPPVTAFIGFEIQHTHNFNSPATKWASPPTAYALPILILDTI